MFFDCHCHLFEEMYGEKVEEVCAEAKKRDTIAINHATNFNSSEEVLALHEKFPWVYPAVGVSPYDAVKHPGHDEKVALLAEENAEKIVAIGEVGLDLHHFKQGKDFDQQKKVFTSMLELAEKLEKPAVIHSRSAETQVLDIINSFSCVKVMHCFVKDKLAGKALEAGCFVSVPTLKSKDRVRILEKTPLERLLFETDSPFLWKGENAPWNVAEVYRLAAEVKGQGFKEVRDAVNANAGKVFGVGLECLTG